jgi:hypothetical protein
MGFGKLTPNGKSPFRLSGAQRSRSPRVGPQLQGLPALPLKAERLALSKRRMSRTGVLPLTRGTSSG